IDINTLPLKQTTITNHKYRAIGLGTFGWHHLLALKGMEWESEEAVDYADELYEQIAYLTIQASMELSSEKTSYPLFRGSTWDPGSNIELKGFEAAEWLSLKNEVKEHGIRNGYLLALAPHSSTSSIARSTASIDPIFQGFYHEE